MMNVAALILAAGSGRRAGGDDAIPKPYRPLASSSGGALGAAMARFLDCPQIDRLRVVIREADRDSYEKTLQGLGDRAATARLEAPVIGGSTRSRSVRNGLEAFAAATPPAVILIHDAARPFVAATTIAAVAAAARRHGAAAAAVPLVDALRGERREKDLSFCGPAVPRDGLWRAQTPQGFDFAALLAAHRRFDSPDSCDDVDIVLKHGLKCVHVRDSPWNVKITHAEDFDRLDDHVAALAAVSPPPDIRIGHGFDAHRFGDGDAVVLCGVSIPHDRALIGWSDADPALHALADAVFGCMGDGDIGLHFPSGEPRRRDAPSRLFVEAALHRLAARGGVLRHIDLVVVCERPRLSPHRDRLIASLGDLVGLPPGRIGFKATTSDGMGFTGRGEGIAAHAHAVAFFRPGSP